MANDTRTMRHSNELIRDYTADGHLYAYREDDEHVVVSNGRDAGDKWERRVPAERTHVAPGEHLWTIPDNWEEKYRIDGIEYRAWTVYHIPESDVDVKVSIPSHNFLVDAWYYVSTVGKARLEFAGEIDREAARSNLERAGDHPDDFSEESIAAARELIEKGYRWDAFVRSYTECVAEFAPEALESHWRHETPKLDSGGTDVWGDTFEYIEDLNEALPKSITDNGNRDLLRDVVSILDHAVPVYPEVKVVIDETDDVVYYVRALVQAGCSSAEALDYFYVEVAGMTQTEWAVERGCDQSTVSKNVRNAKRELK